MRAHPMTTEGEKGWLYPGTAYDSAVDVDVDGKPILVALVGSHAYGTQREDSDLDYRGVYACRTEALYGLNAPQQTVDRKDPDLVVHELAKFCRLAAAANPSVLEVLWAEPQIITNEGEMLTRNRDAFLSTRVLQTYGGYALQQLQKAQRGTGGSRGQAHFRREKFIVHIYRLMEAGIHALKHGEVLVRVPDPEALMAKGSLSLDRVERDFLMLNSRLQAARQTTSLPYVPDFARIESIMKTVRNLNREGR